VILAAPEGVFWKVRDHLRRRSGAGRQAVPPAGGGMIGGGGISPGPVGHVAAGNTGAAARARAHLVPEIRSAAAPRNPAVANDGPGPLSMPAGANQAMSSALCGMADGAAAFVPMVLETLPASEAVDSVAAGVHPPSREGNAVPILEVRNVSRRFGGLQAVRDVSFSVRRGMILGIIGPNGAGKTTLFNLLNGFLRPDTGQVLVNGVDMAGRKPHVLCAAGMGRTFQVMRPFMRLSVLQNVQVGAYVKADSEAQARELARQAVARVGLSDCADQVASTLTTRQLRLMELARALAGQPELLLLDETLAGLGHGEVDDVLAVIRSLSHDGTTIVIIEHTMQAMVRLVDQFVVLDHGEVLVVGDPTSITRDTRVVEAYLGKKWSAKDA